MFSSSRQKVITLTLGSPRVKTRYSIFAACLFSGLVGNQSVTPTVALGGEVFWLGHQRKSGIGFAGRYNTDKVVCITILKSRVL